MAWLLKLGISLLLLPVAAAATTAASQQGWYLEQQYSVNHL
jgi:hypothetical protein